MNFVNLISMFQIIMSALITSFGIWTWNKKRRFLYSHSLLTLYLSVASWLLINTLELLSLEFEQKYFWGRVQYIPLVILPIAWLYFSHSYSRPQYRLNKLQYISLTVTGIVLAVLAFTNEIHHLFWSEVTLVTSSAFPYLNLQIGIVFLLYTFYMFVLIFLGIYQMVRNIRLSGPTQSWQSTILLMSVIAVFASVLVDVLELSFFPEPEWSSLVLACVVPIVGHTLDRLRYADIMPTAYHQVFEHLENGVIVASPDHQIIDMNIRAKSLAIEPDSRDLQEAFPFIPAIRKNEPLEFHSVQVNASGNPLIFDISIAPMTDHRSIVQSNIIVLSDVTERHIRESILLQRNVELEILNQISGYSSSTRELSDLLSFVVELSCIAFKSTSAYIAKVDPSINQLTVMAGFVNSPIRQTLVFSDSSQWHFKISEIAPHLISWLNDPKHHNITHVDPVSDDISNRTLKQFLVQSALSFPILIKDRLYGFISIIESEKHRDFEASEIQLIQSIAHQVGNAIENSQLYRELTEEVDERSLAEEQLRQSLQEKNTLLKEVHHRVKNNLQVISSLLRLQLSLVDDSRVTELIQDSQSRIQSMALVHELLYQSDDLSTIDLGEYLELLSHSLMASYQSKIQQLSIVTDCCSFDVTIETAITCGLLLNELVSNAIKHAFPIQESGTISVSICPMDDHKMQLIVEDNGIGMSDDKPVDHRGNSLGLKLIDGFIKQLDAQLQVKTDSGTRYEIAIPIHKEDIHRTEI